MMIKKNYNVLLIFSMAIFMLGMLSCVSSAPTAYFSGSDMSISLGETKNFELDVMDSDGKPLAKQMVYFQLKNGNRIEQSDVVTTGSDGKAIFNVKAPSQSGTYILSYSLTGLSTHSGSGSNKITLNKNSQTSSSGYTVKIEKIHYKTVKKYVGVENTLYKTIYKPTKKVKKSGKFKYKYYKIYYVYKKYKVYENNKQYKGYKVTTYNNGTVTREYLGISPTFPSYTKKCIKTTKKFGGYYPIKQ